MSLFIPCKCVCIDANQIVVSGYESGFIFWWFLIVLHLSLAVMEIRKCSPVKAFNWLLIGSWNKVIVTSLFLFLPGERSNHDLMPSSQVRATIVFSEDLKSQSAI